MMGEWGRCLAILSNILSSFLLFSARRALFVGAVGGAGARDSVQGQNGHVCEILWHAEARKDEGRCTAPESGGMWRSLQA